MAHSITTPDAVEIAVDFGRATTSPMIGHRITADHGGNALVANEPVQTDLPNSTDAPLARAQGLACG